MQHKRAAPNRAAYIFLAALFAVSAPCSGLVLTGVTLIDVSDRGRSAHDVPDAIVVIENGKIKAFGPRASTRIPTGSKILSRPGTFVIPGLIDGFAGMQNQAEANADLYEGVTSIVGSADDRRGHLFLKANPSPHVYVMDSIGSTDDWSLLRDRPEWRDRLADHDNPKELPLNVTIAQLDAVAKQGTRALWLGHNLTEQNVIEIIRQSHRLGLVTYGEFISAPYESAIADHVDVLLHMSRYELALAPVDLIRPLAASDQGPAVKAAYAAVDNLDANDPSISEFGRTLASKGVALAPTFSLFYLSLPDHRNLWKEPIARIIDPKSLTLASNPATGEMDEPDSLRKKVEGKANRLWAVNQVVMAQHPLYLAASGASTLGALPGIALHVELELLVRCGLSPREALAAATGNYAQQFGWHEVGSVSIGSNADLVVLDANPTLDIKNSRRIRDVILSGHLVDRHRLLHPVATH